MIGWTGSLTLNLIICESSCFFKISDINLLHRRHPDSGGAFKVQIYSPYVVVNKTGLPILVKSVRSTRAGSHEAAGETNPGELISQVVREAYVP